MEDRDIVRLYWDRSEEAIRQSDQKYGSYLNSISYRILFSREDAAECVNDTFYQAWNAMPPHQPSVLSCFLGKITRRLSIDRWRKEHAEKRGGTELPLALEELSECVSGRESAAEEAERAELIKIINAFLGALPAIHRQIFLCRYWYFDPVKEIATQFGFSESKVVSILFRVRKKLRIVLEKEGY